MRQKMEHKTDNQHGQQAVVRQALLESQRGLRESLRILQKASTEIERLVNLVQTNLTIIQENFDGETPRYD